MICSGREQGGRTGPWMAMAALCAIGLVAPGFGAANNSKSLLNDRADALVESLEFARAQARQHRAKVQISAAGSAAGDWSTGWIVWTDEDGDGIAGAKEILRRSTPLPEPLTLHSTTGGTVLRYSPNGLVERADELSLCAGTGSAGLRIGISATGNLLVTERRCG